MRGNENNKIPAQHPIGRYIVDFVCLERKLIIELDGGQHTEQAPRDDVRTRALADLGFRVIRFWNDAVLKDVEGVWAVISEAARHPAPHPDPLPASGERE